ncbi:solute carrier organic anion transporter family member 4C1 [Exaiptasia diaphana]|uniref:Solute carrier organic anion transporter family member n=1 Tax=Exaiptasia diaphana TaxID=2652724 RepID=A0A913WVA4_EXADI|nr:solute carrier organic anion transporter family member 4C1 [Exaiptasia diaphana]KXJ27791.1 Solute carrier organic anion transporter family member 4A1 [Exaiptasia diaphana]
MGSQGTVADVKEIKMALKERHSSKDLWFGWLTVRPKWLQGLNNPKCFLLFVCMYFFTQSIVVNGVYSVSITTIEKRFGYSSSKTGVLTSCYDIAALMLTPFVSYMGAKRKKPKWCGIGLFLMGVGFFIFILPHLFSPKYLAKGHSQEVPSTCHTNVTYSVNQCDQSQTHWGYYLLFIVGMLVIGAGSTPMWNLGTAYMDENVKAKAAPIYIGIFSCSGVMGAGVGFILGGLFLSIYVDLGAQTKLTPQNEEWIGAWWLGFLVSMVMAMLWSVFLIGFPKEFPGTKKLRKLNLIGNSDHPTVHDFGYVQLKDLPKASKALFTNIPYMSTTLGVCIEGFIVSSLTAFMPKVIEQQFSYTASMVSLVLGVVVVPGALLGNFVGAYICKRLSLCQRGASKMCFMVSALSILGVCLLFINCDSLPIVGVNIPYANSSSYGLKSSCNNGCTCPDTNYKPVCAESITYYSPCHAGCKTDFKNGSFGNCSCIQSNDLVTSGFCSSDCGFKPYIYITVYFLTVLLTFLSATPATVVTLRCVGHEQRAYALGIQSSLMRLLGTIPGPVVVGSLIDMTCTLWKKGCDDVANCLQYDNRNLAMVVLITALITKVLTTSCYGISHWFSPKESKDDRNGIVNGNVQYNSKQVYDEEKDKYKDKDVDNNVNQQIQRKLVHEYIDRETKL